MNKLQLIHPFIHPFFIIIVKHLPPPQNIFFSFFRKMDNIKTKIAAELLGPGGKYQVGSVKLKQRYEVRGFVNDSLPHTLPQYYREYLPRYSQRDFVVFGKERISFGEYQKRVAALAADLSHNFRIQIGDRVGIAMRNCPEWTVAFAAVTALGAICVPLNSWWKSEEMEYGLLDSGVSLLFADEERWRRAQVTCATHHIPIILCRLHDRPFSSPSSPSSPPPAIPSSSPIFLFEDILRRGMGLEGAGELPNPQLLSPESFALIMYTSGTTGHPKGVVLTHRSVCEQMIMTEFGNTFRDATEAELAKNSSSSSSSPSSPPLQPCIICPIPLFHVTGSHHIFLASILEGRKLVLMARWHATEALHLIASEKPTRWTGVPTMIVDLIAHPDFDKFDTSSLQVVGGGGAPTPPSSVTAVPKRFTNGKPSQGYGLTETNGAVALIQADEYVANPRATGMPFPIVETKLINTEIGKDGVERGELAVRSSLVMAGYWNKPHATHKVLTHDGWFLTGDICTLSPMLSIVDRAKDIIIRGGENISCSEIESAFYRHEGVMECAAFGIPHERLGEEVALMARVKPAFAHHLRNSNNNNNNSSQSLVSDLLATVQPHLATFKIPHAANVLLVEHELPRGATGKLLKREMREVFAEWKKPQKTGAKL